MRSAYTPSNVRPTFCTGHPPAVRNAKLDSSALGVVRELPSLCEAGAGAEASAVVVDPPADEAPLTPLTATVCTAANSVEREVSSALLKAA